MTSAPTVASLTERSKARSEPAWLAEARAVAFEAFATAATPEWRRTDLSALDVPGLAERASSSPAHAPAPARARVPGVIRMPLTEAAREHPDLVKPILGGASVNDDKWARLHRALWNEGTFLFVEKGHEIKEPITLEQTHAPHGSVRRDVILLDRQAKAHVVVRARGADAPGAFSMDALDLHVRDGATLSLATVQELGRGATSLSNREATVSRDATLAWIDGAFGAKTFVAQNNARLVGQGAALRFIGAFFGAKDQHMDLTTGAWHEGPSSSSQLDMKGALTEDAYSVNYSIVNIGPHAKNASGHQHQETLLLSDKSHADAIPKLDVENNDVSASHGATVGQVDPEQVFYLRSRGFTEARAKRLIVEGFFEPLLREIPVEDVREELRAAILSRLRE